MRVYLIGGLGNNILQVLSFSSLEHHQSIKYYDFLQSHNIVTKILKWKLHPSVIYDMVDIKPERLNLFIILADVLLLYISKITNRRILGRKFLIGSYEIKSSVICGYMHPLSFNDFYRIHNSKKFNFTFVKSAVIAVHIRRGDLSLNPNLGLLTAEYYNLAVKQELTHLCRRVVVYTNDLNWCQSNLNFQFYIPETPSKKSNLLTDFFGLCSSSTLICSNSTFSYSAAILGVSDRIIVPHPFNKNEPIFIPENWIKIHASYE